MHQGATSRPRISSTCNARSPPLKILSNFSTLGKPMTRKRCFIHACQVWLRIHSLFPTLLLQPMLCSTNLATWKKVLLHACVSCMPQYLQPRQASMASCVALLGRGANQAFLIATPPHRCAMAGWCYRFRPWTSANSRALCTMSRHREKLCLLNLKKL